MTRQGKNDPSAPLRDNRESVYDSWLVLRSQAGDSTAFSELFDRWHPRLLRHARRLMGSQEDASDASQDAWISILKGLQELRDPALFQRWAYQIITRRCSDQIRVMQRVRESEPEHARPESQPLPTPDGAEVHRLRAAIRKLSHDRQLMLSLLYLDGLTVAEIATVLEIPLGTVKSRLHLARNELREILEHDSNL